jgi:hypothetical protein
LTDQGDDTDNADSDDKLAPKLLRQRRDVLSRRELKGEGDEGETVADQGVQEEDVRCGAWPDNLVFERPYAPPTLKTIILKINLKYF